MIAPCIRLAAASVLAALAATPAAHGEAVTLQADPQHTGFVERGGPAPPLRRVWTARLDDRVGYAVVGDGKAFVVTAPADGARPRVVALRLRDGRQVWSRDLSGEALPHAAALAYDAGRLFVTRDVYPEARQSAMLALAPADGRVLWETGDRLTLFGAVPPVAADGVVYLSESGAGDGGVSAWSQADGTSLWRVSTEHGSGGSPAVAGDTILTQVACEPVLFRVRRDGTPLVPTSSSCTGGGGGTPVVDGGRVLLHGGPDGEGVHDLATGNRTGALRSDRIPAVARGITLTADARIPGESFGRGHTLTATRADGKVLWRFRGDGYLDSAPLVAARTVYVGSGSGRVFGVDLRTGRRRASVDVGGAVPMSTDDALPTGLAAAEGLLLVPARGRLVALR